MTIPSQLLTDEETPGDALSETQLDERLRQGKLIILLDDAYRQLVAADKSKHFFGNQDDPVQVRFSTFTRKMLTLDAAPAKLEVKRELDWLLYERLPETLRALKSMKRHEYDMFAEGAIENLNTHLNALLDGHAVLTEMANKQAAKMGTVTANNGEELKFLPGTRFPLYETENPEIRAALLKLGTSWVSANASELSTADRYTVNAVVDTYLPEAWGRVQKLITQSPAARAKGEQMLLEQLGLIQQQVDEIVERSTQSAFSAIQAYTLFLQGKITPADDGLQP